MKIIIVDDHQLFAEGLATMLNNEASLEVVEICLSAGPVFNAIANHLPDLVLMDINLGGDINGIALCKKINIYNPAVKVLAVSAHDDYRHISGMIKAGAVGYLLKNSSKAEIITAINTIQTGQTYFRGYVDQILQNHANQAQIAIELNPKETKILMGVIVGKTTKQIAESLNIGVKTVEFYRGTLFVKFGVKNAIELVNRAKLLLEDGQL